MFWIHGIGNLSRSVCSLNCIYIFLARNSLDTTNGLVLMPTATCLLSDPQSRLFLIRTNSGFSCVEGCLCYSVVVAIHLPTQSQTSHPVAWRGLLMAGSKGPSLCAPSTFNSEGEGGSRKPPLRCGKKDRWWCQSQGCSSSLADLKLMHPCDQGVISARGVNVQVQLAGSTSLRRPAHLLLPRLR